MQDLKYLLMYNMSTEIYAEVIHENLKELLQSEHTCVTKN